MITVSHDETFINQLFHINKNADPDAANELKSKSTKEKTNKHQDVIYVLENKRITRLDVSFQAYKQSIMKSLVI